MTTADQITVTPAGNLSSTDVQATPGIPWRDLPARFGDWKNTHRRYRRWCQSGVFERLFQALAEDGDNEYMMPDAN